MTTEIKKGIPAGDGYAVGTPFVFNSEEFRIPQQYMKSGRVEDELERLHEARENALEELETIVENLSSGMDSESTPIVQSYISILNDQTLIDSIEQSIQEDKFSAEYAVSRAFREYKKQMNSSEKASFFERIQSDMNDVRQRWIRNLLGKQQEDLQSLDQEVIVVANELTPAQTATLPTEKVLAFATEEGGQTSHTAIVARELGIPAVVGIGNLMEDISGVDTIVVEGNQGMVFLDPDEETLDEYRSLEQNYKEFEERLEQEFQDKPAKTSDDRQITIKGNIQCPGEIEKALQNGAEGIGLYRTEFLYFDPDEHPSEEHHYNAYRDSLEQLNGEAVTFRTLDIGGDKTLNHPKRTRDENPFLGLRGIRYTLRNSELFREQLRAILRASGKGNAQILFPLISSREELEQALSILEECKADLRSSGIDFQEDIPVGVMVEVPSLALSIDHIADLVDFLSIGTNDLIQYAIAVDRTNADIADLYKPSHPAILRLLKEVLEKGKEHHLPVSLCGEMCSDIKYVVLLLGLGLEIFSVAPTAILKVKKVIRSVSMADAQSIAETAMEMNDPNETEAFLEEHAREIVPEAF